MAKIPNHYQQIADIWIDWEQVNSKIKPGATTNDCTEWTGGRHPQGYPMCGAIDVATSERKMVTLHRVMAKYTLGRNLTPGEVVVHTCSNSQCLNPAHLVVGDLSKRNQVMTANGRHNPQRGKNIRNSKKQNRTYKYTEEEILWIRSATSDEIAQRYNLTKKRASHFRYGMRNNYNWLK